MTGDSSLGSAGNGTDAKPNSSFLRAKRVC